jgi:hypothetical protein
MDTLTKDIFRDMDTPDYVVETYTNISHQKLFKCVCGSISLYCFKSRHTKTKKHIEYIEEHSKIPEIPLPLPTPIPEIQESPIPDVIPEPTLEITPSVPDTPLTKEELRKQKKAIYMREYMVKYHAKRYNEDPVYRQYRKDMVTKSTCKMGARYVKAYQYIKENGINIFDENGN